MNLLFRCDATRETGIGHMMRCLALAEEAMHQGHTCTFFSQVTPEYHHYFMDTSIHLIPMRTSPKQRIDYETILEYDKDYDIDWVVTDHPQMTSMYVHRLQQQGLKVVSIDDLGDILYPSEILLNQNIHASSLYMEPREGQTCLFGSQYVLLRDQVLVKKKRSYDQVRTVLLSFGGITHEMMTQKYYRLIKEQVTDDVDICIVPHPNGSVAHMGVVYETVDLAVTAGGTTCYELAYQGIPNIILSIAPDQVNTSQGFHREGIGYYLGEERHCSYQLFNQVFHQFLMEPRLREEMGMKGKGFVDGFGRRRVMDALLNYRRNI